MAKNEKLFNAIRSIDNIFPVSGLADNNPRFWLDLSIRQGRVSPDDPWVAACLNCVEDSDIPDIALEFFIADIKSGFYDLAG